MTPGRVIVTGASGFIGAAAVRRLLRDGSSVLALVRPGTDRWRLAPLGGERLSVAEWDLSRAVEARSVDELRAIFREFRPEGVLHAGWIGVRGPSRDEPGQTLNVAITVELVRAAGSAGARRFVGLGSQAEYGPSDRAIGEEECPRPATMYGAAKLAAGHLCVALSDRLGLSAAWVRVFSVYGPGERRGALVPDLIRALSAGTPFPLTSCEQRWDYLYEDDAADALARLLGADRARGFFNLASGVARPLSWAVDVIRAQVAPGAELLVGQVPGRPPSIVADVSRLRAAIGWEPLTPFEEGVRRTARALLEPAR